MSRISKVLKDWGYTSDGKAVQTLSFECDTISDLPTIAEMSNENIVMVLGSDAHIIQDDTKYMIKGDGVWVKQKGEFELSLDAAAIDYDNTTSDMAADNIQDAIDEIHATEAEDRAEIAAVANLGAKNLLKIENYSVGDTYTYGGRKFTFQEDGGIKIETAGTVTGNVDCYLVGGWNETTTKIPDGTYKVSIQSTALLSSLQICMYDRSTGSTVSYVRTGTNAPEGAAYTGKATAVFISVGSAITIPSGGIVVYPMIRPAVITDSTFVPYAPTNRELYEMILQLQSAAGLRTVSTLRSAAAPLENKIEEEVTEDEER